MEAVWQPRRSGIDPLVPQSSKQSTAGEGLGERIVKRYQERSADLGPTLACEKLAEDGLGIRADTLVALLKQRHLWQPRRRRGKHRLRRRRRPICFLCV